MKTKIFCMILTFTMLFSCFSFVGCTEEVGGNVDSGTLADEGTSHDAETAAETQTETEAVTDAQTDDPSTVTDGNRKIELDKLEYANGEEISVAIDGEDTDRAEFVRKRGEKVIYSIDTDLKDFENRGKKINLSDWKKTDDSRSETLPSGKYIFRIIDKDGKTALSQEIYIDLPDSVAAVYFSESSMYNYKASNQEYIKTGSYFSETFINGVDIVYYAFARPNENGTASITGTYLKDVLKLREEGVKVLFSVDGANADSLKNLVNSCAEPESRAKFVKSIVASVKNRGFDGVDIDWEFPGTSGLSYTTAEERGFYNALLTELRAAFDELEKETGYKYLLTTAIPASSWGADRFDFKTINKTCDYVNMMSYDLNNSAYATHIASCYSSAAAHDFKFGCDYGTKLFVSKGLDKSKIILGTACYGKAYKITESGVTVDNVLGKVGTLTKVDGVSGSFDSGTLYFNGVEQLINSGKYVQKTEYSGGKVVGSYLYNADENIFVTYDSVEAVKEKCEYAKKNKMGVMLWSYGEDPSNTIVNTIIDNID